MHESRIQSMQSIMPVRETRRHHHDSLNAGSLEPTRRLLNDPDDLMGIHLRIPHAVNPNMSDDLLRVAAMNAVKRTPGQSPDGRRIRIRGIEPG